MATTAITLIVRGRLGSAPEMHYTKNGQAVTNFSLAVEQGFGDHKRTEWVRVAVWGDRQGEAAVAHLSSGDLVECLASAFRVSAWTSKDGTARGQLEITARRVDYIITKRNAAETPEEDESEEIAF